MLLAVSYVGSNVRITSAPSPAPSLALRVWNLVRGYVPMRHAQFYADR